MKKFLLTITSLLVLFACTPEDKEKIEEIVNPKEVVATGIELSVHELTLEKGANSILTVTYTPSDVTKKDITWVSSNTSVATVTDGIVVGVAPGETEIIAKCGDATDKCKVTVVISATGIKLDKTSLNLTKGDSETLVATVEPEGSTDSVTWGTSDESVATVADGLVTAVRAGEATITARAGNQKAECVVIVPVIEAVDLGLSVRWASSNLGASKPEEYGDYYAWGETEPKENYSWSTYKWCNGDYNTQTKYNTDSSYGKVDNKKVLDPEDDAAHVILGGKWRMPTEAECAELRTQCTWQWTTENGVQGDKVIGPNGNSIFLPAADGWRDENPPVAGSYGRYWSSSLYSDIANHALYICFSSDNLFRGALPRCYGFSIRPVTE